LEAAYKKRGIFICPFRYLRPSTAQPVKQAESEYPRR